MAFNVDLSLPHNFENKVRLFPLPNLVLFPGVMQGLHIFEPRYRQLMDDALAADHLITMAVLKMSGAAQFENPFDLRPEIYPTVCIGKIITHSKTEDGRYNLLLVGARRARIVREIMTGKAYRSAEVELVEDSVRSSEEQIAQLRKRLIKSFLNFAKEKQGLGRETIKNMLVDSMPISLLVDLISYAVGLRPEDQIKILETPEADLRCQYVLEMIEKMGSESRPQPELQRPGFPPDFSAN
jgi:ATP-dependent Lon protease